MSFEGVFISFEGVDGCGKTTQQTILGQAVEALGREVILLREPGGTPISEKIRNIVLDPANTEMGDRCELLLFEASRAQLVHQTILPALERGAVVICDRYFDSTYAYQAVARGIDEQTVQMANVLGSIGVVPHRTLIFDIDPEVGYERSRKRGEPDRMEVEGLNFQRKIREGYLQLAKDEPARVRVVDASGSVEEVSAQVRAALDGLGLDLAD